MATSIAPSPPDDAAEAAAAAPAGPPPARPRPVDRFALGVGVAVVAGLALRIAIGLTDGAPSTDETAYLRSGLSLLDGDGFARDGHPELHFPPFVPFLLGLADRVLPDAHAGAVVLTVLAGTALIVLLALLGRRFAGPGAGVVTAWVAALAPGLATMPATRGAGSEAVYVLLVVAAVWLVVSAFDRVEGGRRGLLARVAGAGLLVGLAYLTRPEGLFVGVPLGLAVLVLAARLPGGAALARLGSGAALVLAFAVPLALCVAPYVRYLHDHTGEWQLTAKTQDASIEAWHAVARNDREARDRVLYELDESGLRFSRDATSRTPLAELARDDPAGYAGILATNVWSLARNVGGWWLLPLPAWALAVVGAWRRRRSSLTRLLVVVGLLPVATALAFFVQPRYLIVTVAVASVLVGAAWSTLSGRWRVPVLGATLGLLALSSLAAFVGEGGFWHPGDHTDQRQAGEWIADHTDPADRVMARSMVVEYYAGRSTIAMPYADLEDILRFARHYGVRYLVVDESHASRLRPQLMPLLEGAGEGAGEGGEGSGEGGGEPGAGDTAARGLRLVHEVRTEGRVTRVFALDPPPSVSAEQGPTLGFMGDGAPA